jgi:UDP-glucose 4-epimerase
VVRADVIEAVKRASGTDFTVRYSPRRPGDPAALVAGAGRIYDVLGWEPRLDNLGTIVEGALSWEKYLQKSRKVP